MPQRVASLTPDKIRLDVSPWLLRLGLTAPYLIFLCAAYSVFAQTVDDPYITFRYAAHLLAGDGPVFNLGERVEGYTSPLHLILATGLLAVLPSVDILFKAKCASLLFGFVMLAQTRTLARRSGLSLRESVLAQALVALNINFALASVNALETTLYGSLLLASTLVFLGECRRRQGHASGLLLFFALLARPEASLVVAALTLVRLYWLRRRRLPARFAGQWLLAFLLPLGAYELARWEYYGQLLPNTYFAKAQPPGKSLAEGFAYLLKTTSPGPLVSRLFVPFFAELSRLNRHTLFDFGSVLHRNLRSDSFYILMPLLFWALALTGFRRAGRRLPGIIGLAVTAATVAFVLRSGGDWMYGWRFVVPVLPFVAVAQCHGVRRVSRRVSRWVRSKRRRVVPAAGSVWAACGLVVAGFWLVSCLKTAHFSWERADFSTQGSRMLDVSEGYGPLWVKGADYVHSLPPGSTLAYSEMGYAGYSNMDKTMIDIRGLTDGEIAHLSSRYKNSSGVVDNRWYLPDHPLAQIMERRRPSVILSFNDDPPDAFLSGYRRSGTLTMPTNDKQGLSFVYVYQRL